MHITEISNLARGQDMIDFLMIMKCDNNALQNCSKTMRHKMLQFDVFIFLLKTKHAEENLPL